MMWRLGWLVLLCGCADGGGADGLPTVDAGPRDGREDAAPVACTSDDQCDDSNVCTTDLCVSGACTHEPLLPGTSCDADGDLCNGMDTCDGEGACVPGEPVVCEPVGACRSTECLPETGECVVRDDASCCTDDADCPAPEGVCAVARCNRETNACEEQVVPDCCADDTPCEVDAICAIGRCDEQTRACVVEPLEGCCAEDTDCPDLGSCVRSYCDTATNVCATEGVARCCEGPADCPGDACNTATCDVDTGLCGRDAVPDCCLRDADCPADRRCVANACVPRDADGDGVPHDRDCDDNDPARFPGNPEVCDDGIDNDCDQATDGDDPDCGADPEIRYAAIQFPLLPVEICAGEPTPLLFGRVFVPGVTPGPGQGAGITAAVGYGPDRSRPDDTWTWTAGAYNGDLPNGFGELNDDEYRASLAGVPAGAWDIAWRFRVGAGDWVYADLAPLGSDDGYDPATTLTLTAAECPPPPVDADGDGSPAGEDCDDDDPARFPASPEHCGDGIDNDCDLEVDEGCDPPPPVDADGDGSPAGQDCDDDDPARFPASPEHCGDGIDNDCDLEVDEGCPEPPSPIEYAAIQFPVEPITICAGEPTPLVFGRVYVPGRTPGQGPGDGIEAQLGYGPDGSAPGDAWTWTAARYNGDLHNGFGELNDDEYRSELAPVPAGEWDLAYRFRVDLGPWVYADLGPAGTTDGYAAETSLGLTVRDDCAP